MRSSRLGRRAIAAVLTVAACWCAGAAAEEAAAAAPRPLTIDDYFRIGRVDEPQVSPDGRWVAYTVETSDLAEDEV
ncbi:MAG: hypothetical protein H6Q02_1761, partial [Acidobacteria bacterium]|nr:hypothetical protein [Acidobacteriota bacterium]